MPKTVIHVFHDDDASVTTGTRVAQRILEVADERGCEVEVFCFGPAQRRLAGGDGSGGGGGEDDGSEATAVFRRQVDELVAAGVVVGACVNAARADGTEADLEARGLRLRVARDEFVRFTLEQATVVSF